MEGPPDAVLTEPSHGRTSARFRFLVTRRARMLASPHSVSENGAPCCGLSSSQEARVTIALARRSAAFKRALHCFDNQVAVEARVATVGMRRARLRLRGIHAGAADQPRRS